VIKTAILIDGAYFLARSPTVQRKVDVANAAQANGVLYRWLQAPLDPLDLQVFAEGLVAVSRLDILNARRIPEKEACHD